MTELREYPVTVPMGRLIDAAERVGFAICPVEDDHICWRHRDLKPHIDGKLDEIECVNCWLRFFTHGD